MPIAPPHPCAVSMCPHMTPCPVHPRVAWRGATPAPPRIRGRKLQRLIKQLFDRQPLCVVCQAAGRVTVATIRDHVINLAAPGATDTEDNVQAICDACHAAKTAAEAARGRRR